MLARIAAFEQRRVIVVVVHERAIVIVIVIVSSQPVVMLRVIVIAVGVRVQQPRAGSGGECRDQHPRQEAMHPASLWETRHAGQSPARK
jgi:hypothetical protein